MFRKTRLNLGWTQSEMADHLGVALVTWRRWENGQALPARPLAGCPRWLEAFVLDGREMLHWGQFFPYELPAASPSVWRRASDFWSKAVRGLGLSTEVSEWLEQTCSCDSALEAFAWLQLARDQQRWLVWAQVSLLAEGKTFRCDGLILNQPGYRPRRQILEFDGAGHNFSNDDYRRRVLGMSEIRISGAEVKSMQTLERFLKLTPAPPGNIVAGMRRVEMELATSQGWRTRTTGLTLKE